MQDLVASLIKIGCWLAIAASPTLIGLFLAGMPLWYVGHGWGLALAFAFVMLGIAAGALLANYAAKRGALVQFASGLPPPPVQDDTKRTYQCVRADVR